MSTTTVELDTELRAWEDFYSARSAITSEMEGAANYFDADPDYATDARLAEAFRMYVARIRAVTPPEATQ